MVFDQTGGGGLTQNQTLIAKIKFFDIECVSSDMHTTYIYLMIAYNKKTTLKHRGGVSPVWSKTIL